MARRTAGSKKRASKQEAPVRAKRAPRSPLQKTRDRFARAGKSPINVKSGEFTVQVTDLQAVQTVDCILLNHGPFGVTIRHKKSKGGSTMRVSHVPASNVLSVHGAVGEAAHVVIQRPAVIALYKGTVQFTKTGSKARITDVNGETVDLDMNNTRFLIEMFADEKGVKPAAKRSRRAAPEVDEDDFDDE